MAEKSTVRDYIVLEQIDDPPLGDNPVGTTFVIRRVVRARNDTAARRQVVDEPMVSETDEPNHAGYRRGKLVAIPASGFTPKKPNVTTKTVVTWEDA